jgi:hypothetical protein
MRYPALLLGSVILLGIVSCSDTGNGPPSVIGDGSSNPNNVIPFASLTGGADSESLAVPASWTRAAKPVEAAPVNVSGQTALLNEVSFLPAAGDSQFVEIRAAAGGTVASGLTLKNESGDTYVLPDGLVLVNNDLLLVRFDGQATLDGLTVHADRSTFLNSSAGSLVLLDQAGTELDRVSWGSKGGDSLALGVSDNPNDFTPGITFGRLPQSNAAAPHSWVVYLPVEATPGAPNVNVGVDVLFPLNGTVSNSGDTTLSWYPAPGATGYQVQLANNPELTSLLLDTTVTSPLTNITLGEGTYYWQVRVLYADNSKSDWSLRQVFTLDDGVDLSGTGGTSAKAANRRKGTPPLALLAVPMISQRKDTNLLLLESFRTDAGHGWDEPHPTLDVDDWADNMNCALACTQMVNHYFHGTLSQDRIGFQMHQNDRDGPEGDLNYGQPNPIGDVLNWAVGRSWDGGGPKPVHDLTYPKTYGDFWRDVTGEINEKRPVALLEKPKNKGAHFILVVGYDIRNGKNYFVVNNPWNPNSAIAFQGLRQYDLIALCGYYLIGKGTLAGRDDEKSIGDDQDNDTIKDFDEEMRFGTNKTLKDTDMDCIEDKEEIRNSMFDPAHGWALYWNNKGGDGKARRGEIVLDGNVPISGRPELENDSDGGGLADVMEVFSGTDPTNPDDDHRHITGTIDDIRHWETDYSNPNDSNTMAVSDERYHVEIDLQTDPDTKKLKGTAKVTYTNHAYRVYRHPFSCDAGQATQLNIDHPDRQWTVKLTGSFYCWIQDGKRVIHIGASGAPDHSDAPDTITYHDTCYSDTQPVSSRTGKWGGFTEVVEKPDAVDVRVDHPLPSGVTSGEDSHTVHLKIER